MPAHLSRRRLFQAATGLAVSAGTAGLVGTGGAEAASPVGSVVIDRIWGKRSIRQRIPGTRRYRTIRVPISKHLYLGTYKRVLDKGGLCHWFGTSMPLENGNCVLFGHRTSAGGPLRRSERLRVGDPITITSNGLTLTYYVSQAPFVISAADFSPVVTWGDVSVPCLTLVSCTMRNKMPTSTKYRLLVRATATGPAAPVTPAP
jgi:hypothetical protein